ncbi:ornithine cyclodeaminase family protein [Brevibacillus sp. NRS-1366]|uniref:ornithine cyclodeaminase family protein n=1 Tax=Brevibacillus sp. NRS-1366 TaxID=3233899 RepID=UPI003D224ADE
MPEITVINQELVKDLFNMDDAIQIVEKAFTEFDQEKSKMFPAIREMVPEHQGIFGIKSSYLLGENCIGLKAGGFWSENSKKQKMNHQSTMLLFNAETGEPTCLLDANQITTIRTAAAGAIAAKYLARKNSKVVGIIGSGTQARAQLEGILHLFPIKEVNVWSRNKTSGTTFAQEIIERGIKAHFISSPDEVVSTADIVITTSPSFSPVIKTSWVKKGAHINAIGSDTKGKQEILIDTHLNKVVCDFWEQSSIMGELQHGFSKDSLYAEIGQITSGAKPGRQYDGETTLFDSTGLSVQDVKSASYIYEKAKMNGLGYTISI